MRYLLTIIILVIASNSDASKNTKKIPEQPPKKVKLKTSAKLIMPIAAGMRAPYTGMLVPELKFYEFLYDRTEKLILQMRFNELKALKDDLRSVWTNSLKSCQTDLNKRARPSPWYKSPYFWFPIGIVLGTVTGVFVYHGAAKLAR